MQFYHDRVLMWWWKLVIFYSVTSLQYHAQDTLMQYYHLFHYTVSSVTSLSSPSYLILSAIQKISLYQF